MVHLRGGALDQRVDPSLSSSKEQFNMFSEREGRNRMWLYKIKAHVSLKKFTPILKGLWHCPIMSKQEVTVPHVAMNIFISILQRCVWEQQKGLNGEEETV